MAAQSVVLVEGVSDRVALEVLARRHGIDLAAAGTTVVAMHGITNIGHFLSQYSLSQYSLSQYSLKQYSLKQYSLKQYSPTHDGGAPRISGLYDKAEERFVVSGLEWAGLGSASAEADRAWLEAHGFFRCSADLEDELIRALGPEAVEDLVAAEGQLRSFRTLQKQPALRARSLHDQLRRLMGGRSGGKERYAALMAEAVPLERVPRPLAQVLAWTVPR